VIPFRLDIRSVCVADDATVERQAKANAHYPRIQRSAAHGRRLAIAGGGPLLDVDALAVWDGDIWAINHTAQWLNDRGIKATLFTVDPEHFETRVSKSIPSVSVFDMVETHEDGFTGGRFSSTRAPAVALHMGYTDISFFGCEGSFLERDHIDRDENRPEQLIIRASGKDYRTCPQFVAQCEELLQLFFFDGVFHNRSGGLLTAMQDDPDWYVVAVSEVLKGHLELMNGKCGIYEHRYHYDES
jgi:hypothetical protein